MEQWTQDVLDPFKIGTFPLIQLEQVEAELHTVQLVNALEHRLHCEEFT